MPKWVGQVYVTFELNNRSGEGDDYAGQYQEKAIRIGPLRR